MDWKMKVRRGVNQVIDQSKQLLGKAKKQALGIGEQTLLAAEIKELRQIKERLYGTLGKEIYVLLLEKGRSSVSVRTPEIKDQFPELEKVISELSAKEMLSKKEEKNQK